MEGITEPMRLMLLHLGELAKDRDRWRRMMV